MKQNICVVAGEASGDEQAARVVESLKKQIQGTEFESVHFWGAAGPALRAQGMEAFLNSEDLAVMGFLEVVRSYLSLSQSYKKLLQEIVERRPIALIVVDYPAFNLRLVQDAFALGVTVLYHIPPKVWAHGAARAEVLRNSTHLVTSILPFEQSILAKKNVHSVFVGNPLKDAAMEYRNKHPRIEAQGTRHKRIGLLPGSRRSELERHVSLLVESFAKLCKERSDLNFTADVPIASMLSRSVVVEHFVAEARRIGEGRAWVEKHFRFDAASIHETLSRCDYAWVCSGTASLEAAFFEVPHAVFYRTSAVTFAIGKALVKDLKFVGLGNLCAAKEIVPEYLQDDARAENLVWHALKLLEDDSARSTMKANLASLLALFPENSAQRAAEAMLQTLREFGTNPTVKYRMHRERREKARHT